MKYLWIPALIIGVLIGWFIALHYKSSSLQGIQEKRLKAGKYTSPLIECSEGKPLPIKNLVNLESRLEEVVGHYGTDVTASVYVRDLSNGGWVEATNGEVYYPASLMKLPAAITLLKASETNPQLLSEKITTTQTQDLPQNIITGELLKADMPVSYDELLRHSIEYSDNKANMTIMEHLGIDAIQNVLDELGVKKLTTVDDYQIDPRIYARFLRVLYNATYLNKDNSEKLLSYLSNVKYEKGIKQGIPKTITVAHKFGERVVESPQGNSYQLHDCGIVYAKHPYIICVMSKGTSFEQLSKLIGELSQETYQAMK